MLVRAVVGLGRALGGRMDLEGERRLRAEAWCDFLVCDGARWGIVGLSQSLAPLEARVVAV